MGLALFQFMCRIQHFYTWYQSEVGKLIASESQGARDGQQESIVGETPGSSLRSSWNDDLSTASRRMQKR